MDTFETCPFWWCGRKVWLDGKYSFDAYGKATLLSKISSMGLNNEELTDLKNLAISAINNDISQAEFREAVAGLYRDLASVIPIMTYSEQIKLFYLMIVAVCLYLLLNGKYIEFSAHKTDYLPHVQEIDTQQIDSLFKELESQEIEI